MTRIREEDQFDHSAYDYCKHAAITVTFQVYTSQPVVPQRFPWQPFETDCLKQYFHKPNALCDALPTQQYKCTKTMSSELRYYNNYIKEINCVIKCIMLISLNGKLKICWCYYNTRANSTRIYYLFFLFETNVWAASTAFRDSVWDINNSAAHCCNAPVVCSVELR